MKNFFETYGRTFTIEEVSEALGRIKAEAKKNLTSENLKKAYSFIDLTSLNSTDTRKIIAQMTRKVSEYPEKYPDMPQVAAICVYPNFVEVVKDNLTDKNVSIACVAGAFPSAQTFINIKTAEIREAIYHGTDEVDIVFNIGEFLNEDYVHVFHELKKMRKNAEKIHLKVILETGLLPDLNSIYKASILAMEAGADFIKTSTGKEKVGATPEAVYVMAIAVKDFFEKTGKKTGIKPAGGVSNSEIAIFYMQIIKEILGEQWLDKNLFRIGTSSLANKLISEITGSETNYF